MLSSALTKGSPGHTTKQHANEHDLDGGREEDDKDKGAHGDEGNLDRVAVSPPVLRPRRDENATVREFGVCRRLRMRCLPCCIVCART